MSLFAKLVEDGKESSKENGRFLGGYADFAPQKFFNLSHPLPHIGLSQISSTNFSYTQIT